MVKVMSKKKRLTPRAVFSCLLLMFTTAFCAASNLPVLAQAAQQTGNQGGQTTDTNVQSVATTQKGYFDRNPEAKAYMDLKGEGKTDNTETTITNKFPYDYKTPPGAWQSKAPSNSSHYDTDTYTCTGAPSTDCSDAIHGNHVASRTLEKAFIPERMMHAATGVAGVAANNAANSEASMAVNQAFSAIDYSKQFLANFTAEPGNVWQAIRDQLFIPMAVLLLLPGAVLAQVRAIVAQGSPVLIGQEVHPFEGILRSIVAIFLIPATFLVINYGIDVANSITFTIADEYRRLFGSDMYEDAKCAIQRAYPTNRPQDNRNAIDQTARPRASGGLTVFATLERNTIGLALIDPCLGIYESIMPDETVPQAVNIMRSVLNGMGASAAMSWNVACAFQMAFLYYLWCMGPVAAALWVWPIAKMRAALGTWVEGVVTICFWSLFWNTVILLIACFKGVGFTGTIIVSALLSLAILSIKSAFDFSGLAASAADMAMQQALKAAQQASKGGGGGGGGSNSGGGNAGGKQGGQAPASGDKHQPSHGDRTASTPGATPSSTPVASSSTSGDTTSSAKTPGSTATPGSAEGKPTDKPGDDVTGAPPGTAPTSADSAKNDANKGPEVAPPPNADGPDSAKDAANKGDADAANKGKEAGKGDGAGAGLPPGAGAGLGAGTGGPTNTSGVDVKGSAVVNQSHDAKTSSDDKLGGKDQPAVDIMGGYTGMREPLSSTTGTNGTAGGALPGAPNGPNGQLDANGRPVGPDGAVLPGAANDPNSPQRLAGDANTTQNAGGVPTVAPDAARFEAASNNLAKEGLAIASNPKFDGMPGSNEAKALGTVAAGENANLYKAAVNDPTGINPTGVSNADAFKNATGVSAQTVTEAAQGNPQAGREVQNALSSQTNDRSVVGSPDTARSLASNPPADTGRSSAPDTSVPGSVTPTQSPQPGNVELARSASQPDVSPSNVNNPGPNSQPAAVETGRTSTQPDMTAGGVNTTPSTSPSPSPTGPVEMARQGGAPDMTASTAGSTPSTAPTANTGGNPVEAGRVASQPDMTPQTSIPSTSSNAPTGPVEMARQGGQPDMTAGTVNTQSTAPSPTTTTGQAEPGRVSSTPDMTPQTAAPTGPVEMARHGGTPDMSASTATTPHSTAPAPITPNASVEGGRVASQPDMTPQSNAPATAAPTGPVEIARHGGQPDVTASSVPTAQPNAPATAAPTGPVEIARHGGQPDVTPSSMPTSQPAAPASPTSTGPVEMARQNAAPDMTPSSVNSPAPTTAPSSVPTGTVETGRVGSQPDVNAGGSWTNTSSPTPAAPTANTSTPSAPGGPVEYARNQAQPDVTSGSNSWSGANSTTPATSAPNTSTPSAPGGPVEYARNQAQPDVTPGSTWTGSTGSTPSTAAPMQSNTPNPVEVSRHNAPSEVTPGTTWTNTGTTSAAPAPAAPNSAAPTSQPGPVEYARTQAQPDATPTSGWTNTAGTNTTASNPAPTSQPGPVEPARNQPQPDAPSASTWTNTASTSASPSSVPPQPSGQAPVAPVSNTPVEMTRNTVQSDAGWQNTAGQTVPNHGAQPVVNNQPPAPSENHFRVDSGSGATPVSYTNTSHTVTPNAPQSGGGEVRLENGQGQNTGTAWTQNQTWTTSNEPQRPAQTWSETPVNREAPPAPNQIASNNLERPSAPEHRPAERAEYRAEPGSSSYVPPIIGQAPQAPQAPAPQSPTSAPGGYVDHNRVNETHAQQQRVGEQQRQVEHQQQQQRAQEQQRAAEAQRPPSAPGKQQAPVPPQVFVQPHQQPPARPDAQRPPQQQPQPQQAKQADAGAPPEAPKSKDNPLAPNSNARSGGPTQKSIGDVLRKMGPAPGSQPKKKRKPGDPPEQ